MTVPSSDEGSPLTEPIEGFHGYNHEAADAPKSVEEESPPPQSTLLARGDTTSIEELADKHERGKEAVFPQEDFELWGIRFTVFCFLAILLAIGCYTEGMVSDVFYVAFLLLFHEYNSGNFGTSDTLPGEHGKERTPPSTIIECPSASAVITEPDSGQQSQITMRHATGSFVLTKKPLQEESGAVNHGIDYNIRNHKPNTVFLLSETKEVGDKSHTVEGVDRDQVCTLPVREKTDSATVCLKWCLGVYLQVVIFLYIIFNGTMMFVFYVWILYCYWIFALCFEIPHTRINKASDLKPGDAVALGRWLGYEHHAIILDVKGEVVESMEFSTGDDMAKATVRRKQETFSEMTKHSALHRLEYEEPLPPAEVTGTAEKTVGDTEYHFLWLNCQQHVHKCKLGYLDRSPSLYIWCCVVVTYLWVTIGWGFLTMRYAWRSVWPLYKIVEDLATKFIFIMKKKL